MYCSSGFYNGLAGTNIYETMIYTAPYVMLLMRGKSLTRASGRGLGPGNRDFLGPVKWHRAVLYLHVMKLSPIPLPVN
jgi:hypothetical protein